MEKVVETEEYKTLYENYLHVCSELSKMEAKNNNLKEANERLEHVNDELHVVIFHLKDTIVQCIREGGEC